MATGPRNTFYRIETQRSSISGVRPVYAELSYINVCGCNAANRYLRQMIRGGGLVTIKHAMAVIEILKHTRFEPDR
jgi:hypothetical protein